MMIDELNRLKNGCGFKHAIVKVKCNGKYRQGKECITSEILTVIREHKNITRETIKKKSGYSLPTIRKYLTFLLDDNKITATEVGTSRRFTSFVYNKVSDNG